MANGKSQTAPAQAQAQAVENAALDAVIQATLQRQVEYVPLGETESVKLNRAIVLRYLARPTKKGTMPSDEEVMRFVMLCRARGLNPWVGDAYLVGYDGEDGPTFSLITSLQALLKRAEANPQFDGLEQGVIVLQQDGTLHERQGDFVLEGEALLGGWARCYRKDRSKPVYDSLKLSTYNTSRSRWRKDPAGMIVKCAQASVLRESFPTQTGGLYTADEMGREHMPTIEDRQEVGKALADTKRQLADLLKGDVGERRGRGESQPQAEPAQPEADQTVVVDEPPAETTTQRETEFQQALAYLADADHMETVDATINAFSRAWNPDERENEALATARKNAAYRIAFAAQAAAQDQKDVDPDDVNRALAEASAAAPAKRKGK